MGPLRDRGRPGHRGGPGAAGRARAPRRSGDGVADLGVYLVLISALTLPHVGVVVLMDRRQGVWRRGAAVDVPAAP
ncbi:hypothetical protein [Amnibacterium kyonggiense]